MQAPVLHGRRTMTYEEVAAPTPRDGEVVLEVGLCGICGSDLHLYDSPMAPDGAVLGHEFGATIVEIGPKVEGWSLGERVVATMPEPCRECYFCRRGEAEMCYQHRRIEAQRAAATSSSEPALGAGGYGPLTRMMATRLLRVPEALDDRQAACVEPAAVGFHAVRRSGMRLGDTAVVIGAGPIGLFTLQCARAAGARRIVVLEMVAARAQAAAGLGADELLNPRENEDVAAAVNAILPGGPDVVFDAAGVPATLQQAVDLVRPGGQVMMVGAAFENAPIRPSAWVTKRVTVRAAFAYSRDDYRATMALMERGAIDIEPLVSDIVPASETAAAFERLLQPNTEIKVLVDPRR